MTYLKHGHIDTKTPKPQRRAIEVEVANYQLIKDQLYRRGKDGNLRMCVNEADYLSILTHAHAGVGGGHFSGETTAKLIKWFGLWWPTLHMDVCTWMLRNMLSDVMSVKEQNHLSQGMTCHYDLC